MCVLVRFGSLAPRVHAGKMSQLFASVPSFAPSNHGYQCSAAADAFFQLLFSSRAAVAVAGTCELFNNKPSGAGLWLISYDSD